MSQNSTSATLQRSLKALISDCGFEFLWFFRSAKLKTFPKCDSCLCNQAFITGVPEVMIDFFPLSLFNLYYYTERFCCPSRIMFTKPTRTNNKVIHTHDRYTSVRPANLR